MSNRDKRPKRSKYIKCPLCGEKLDSIMEWVNTTIGYERDLKTGDILHTREGDYSDFEAYSCPECGEDLDEKTCKKINKMLWGI